jgi:tail protein P2 I
MSSTRVPLYARLPEIYRIRDAEQTPPDQLRAFLAAVEQAFGAVHENIEALYQDFFIDTCDDWVVPYIADLLGTTHLKGDPRTLRADVADTIALRRRKGTLSAMERLAANLTGWPCRCVELFQRLEWSQHLNHQRPDAGGLPPYGLPSLTRF